MNGKSYFIQIILELKSGGLYELFVFGIMRNFRKSCGNFCPPQVLQIDINEPITLRQQTGRFRRSMLAEENHYCDRNRNQQNASKDGEFASKSH